MPSTRKKRRNSRGRRRGGTAPKTPRHGGRGGLQRVRALKLEGRSDLPSPIPPPSPTSTDTTAMALEQTDMCSQGDARRSTHSGVTTLYRTPEQMQAVPRIDTPTLLRKESLLKSSGATAEGKRRKPGMWLSALQGIAMVRDGILDAVIPLRKDYRRVQTQLTEKEELLAEVTAHNERLQGLLVDALANQREEVPTASAGVQTDERLLRTALAKPRRTRSCASQTAAVKVSTHATQTAGTLKMSESKAPDAHGEKRVAAPQRRRQRYNVLPAPVFHPTKTVATQTRSAACDSRSYKQAALYRADAPLPAGTRLTDPVFGSHPQARAAHTEMSTQTTPPQPSTHAQPATHAGTQAAACAPAAQAPAPASLAPPPPPPPPPPPLPPCLTASATPLRLTKKAKTTPKTGSPLKRGGPLRPLNFSQEQLSSARLKPVRDAENTPPPMSLAGIEASTVQQARTRLRKTNAARSPGGTPRKQMVNGGGTGILPSLYAALVERFRNARSPPSHESSAAPSPA